MGHLCKEAAIGPVRQLQEFIKTVAATEVQFFFYFKKLLKKTKI